MWKNKDVEKLLLMYDSEISIQDISIELSKTELSIYKKLYRLNKYKGKNKFWSQSEEEELKILSKNLDIEEISKTLNRSKDSVRKKMDRLKIIYIRSEKEKIIDWESIQKEYNSGKTYKDIVNTFKVSPIEISEAQKNGKLKLRSLKESYENSIKTGKRKLKNKDSENFKDYREMCLFKFNLMN